MIGPIKEFNPDNKRIRPYLKRLALFLRANKIADDDKVPAFLTVIGGRAYTLLCDLLSPTKPEDTAYADLVSTLHDPKPLVIAERFHFHNRNQASGESITEFLAELRRLAAHGGQLTILCRVHTSSTLVGSTQCSGYLTAVSLTSQVWCFHLHNLVLTLFLYRRKEMF